MKKLLSQSILSILIIWFAFASCKQTETEPEQLRVYELTEKVNGLSYGDLEEISTLWLLGLGLDKTAANDPDGKLAAANLQPNPNVTILPFNFGGKSNRNLTISASKPVYVPILGYSYWYFDNDPCDPNFKPAAGQTVEAFLQPYMDELFKEKHSVSAKLDGKDVVSDVKKYLAKSKAFEMLIPADYQDPACTITNRKAHILSNTYSLLMKIPKGKHTLILAGAFPNTDPNLNFETDITWNLTVE